MAPGTLPSRRRKILLWSLVAGLAFVLVPSIISAFLLWPPRLKESAERKLSERLGLDVTIETLSLSLLPRPRISGTNMVLRVPSQPQLPPFVSIGDFWVDIGLFSALRRHVDTVHLGGMQIFVPPGDAKKALKPANSGGTGEVVVEHLQTHDAVLTMLQSDPARTPLVFKIHNLTVDDVGFEGVMPFATTLTNPIPEGHVESRGTIGPWDRDDPTNLPLTGSYTFTLANLDTIKGIGGTLTSQGDYRGRLTAIAVSGRTQTPDFNLDLGGQSVPLDTTFEALVNGSDGTTKLERVDAKIFNTSIRVTGLFANLPGPGRRAIDLNMEIADGRIEDILTLLVDSRPFLSGDVTLNGTISLPPGETPVRDRLVIKGRFGLAGGQFSDGAVQAKLHELSRRSQGKDEGERMARVVTRLSGQFMLASSMLRLPKVSFAVPGADITLGGAYALQTKELDFTGTLRMQTSVSNAIGGTKSIFIKPFDWIFRKDGAGAVVPIKITGQRDAPKIGVQMGKVFSSGDGK